MGRLGSIALLAGLIAGVVWAGRQSANNASTIDAAWVRTHEYQLRRILNLPASASIELKQVRESEEPDYLLAQLELVEGEAREELELYVSRDGRRIVYDQPYELADPFGAIREQIRLEEAPYQGVPDAPVTIVEYVDYTCGYCRAFALQLEQPLLARYGEKVHFVIKQYPLAGLRGASGDASRAAVCAFRESNEKFWALHSRLWREPRWRTGRAALLEVVGAAGLEPDAVAACMSQPETDAAINRDLLEARRLGVEGTPAFFVNGRPVRGLPPGNTFFQIVEQELAAANRE
ncbi:MAG: thioredoxin domain-containing protein [Acidobacteria bacterium]|nr:thioredoxin domain-containing protein [Acidobacteriota bacterium]